MGWDGTGRDGTDGRTDGRTDRQTERHPVCFSEHQPAFENESTLKEKKSLHF